MWFDVQAALAEIAASKRAFEPNLRIHDGEMYWCNEKVSGMNPDEMQRVLDTINGEDDRRVDDFEKKFCLYAAVDRTEKSRVWAVRSGQYDFNFSVVLFYKAMSRDDALKYMASYEFRREIFDCDDRDMGVIYKICDWLRSRYDTTA